MKPAEILLAHIPEEDRLKVLGDLVSSLKYGDEQDLDLVVSLAHLHSDEDVLRQLSEFFGQALKVGSTHGPTRAARGDPQLAIRLFDQAASSLGEATSAPGYEQRGSVGITSYLHLAKSIFPLIPVASSHKTVYCASLKLMTADDGQISNAAKATVFAFLGGTDSKTFHADVLEPCQEDLWRQVLELTSPTLNVTTHLLGYSLWLRWLISMSESAITECQSDTYWNLVLQGFRKGDSEVRKLCLQIYRLSMAATSKGSSATDIAAHERYATLFETIILGRYINQVQECENDMNSMIIKESSMGAQWTYVLLASALDKQMQDSNRKFIGDWVMRAEAFDGLEYISFFRDSFLPWAVLGHHFVSSLTLNGHGHATCPHGERLAYYISSALRHHRNQVELQSIIINCISSRKTFAYAKVFLLKALADRLPDGSHSDGGSVEGHSAATRWIGTDASVADILHGLPEAARQYCMAILMRLGVPVSSHSVASRRVTAEDRAINSLPMMDDLQRLEGLWDELEELEYPKRLLLRLPKVLLCDALLQRAIGDTALAESMRSKVETLQKVATTKTYLISPLHTAVRTACLSYAQAFDLLDITEYILRAVDHPPQATADLLLEEVTVTLFASYEDYFDDRPSYGIAALLDLVSRMEDQHQVQDLVERLMRPWKAQKNPPPVVSSWKTVDQLQTLLLCLEIYESPDSQDRPLLLDLLQILSIEPLPRFRYLLEWMTVRFTQRTHQEDIVLQQLSTKDHHSNPKYLASLMKVGSVLSQSLTSTESFAQRLAVLFLPLAASSKVVIRHQAQWQVPRLVENARSRGWRCILDNAAISALDDYIRSLSRFQDAPLERQIEQFDAESDHHFTNLVEGPWLSLDKIATTTSTSRAEFVKLYAHDVPSKFAVSCIPLGEKMQQRHAAQNAGNTSIANTPVRPRTIDEVTALQTKGTAYLARTLSDPGASGVTQNSLIVVGSLVDNPYNLGGLSRVSEIFGASALTVQNQNVIGNKDFTSVAVSSHLHLPMIQLSAPGVPAFLAQRREEGFTVVGIEQTSRSQILGSKETQLPAKCVLVVGSEKEGIPAITLTECDILVEIPQRGITRSLNVQTAVSIVLFDYARQHSAK